MKNMLIADNHNRKSVIIEPSELTVRQAFLDNGMQPEVGLPFLNGVAVPEHKLDETILNLAGEADEYRLTKTVKSDGNF